MKATGRVTNGKLQVPNSFFSNIAVFEGQTVDIEVTKHKNRRSVDQNAYYWGVVVYLLSQHTGFEMEEMHDALKWKFLHHKEFMDLQTPRSSTDLSMGEFTDYIERIRRWAAQELNVNIPDPE